MKKYLAFALALIMALALIPGIALADKGGPGGGGDPAAVIPAADPVAAVIPAVSRAAT